MAALSLSAQSSAALIFAAAFACQYHCGAVRGNHVGQDARGIREVTHGRGDAVVHRPATMLPGPLGGITAERPWYGRGVHVLRYEHRYEGYVVESLITHLLHDGAYPPLRVSAVGAADRHSYAPGCQLCQRLSTVVFTALIPVEYEEDAPHASLSVMILFTASRTSAEEWAPPDCFITNPMTRLAAFSFFL